MDYKGRFLNVIDDTSIRHYGIKNGDYLLFSHMEGDCEYWGDYYNRCGYFGEDCSSRYNFELMHEGFIPETYYFSSRSKLPKIINYEIY